MKTSLRVFLERFLTVFMLWGCGWKRRRQSGSESYRIEWQDPMTGQWYGERNAMKLLKVYALAEYGKTNFKTDHYRAYF
ncbi:MULTISPECIES: hypothetical protein [Methylocaldum]|jgi:hypothetical protein|uniref:hypothetical protein n=1 Tax=unclassified Methylocaldum TaxID=2622260 RepID=UPI001060B659|nr:hypothetical protein [Methylocaldum sp.]